MTNIARLPNGALTSEAFGVMLDAARAKTWPHIQHPRSVAKTCREELVECMSKNLSDDIVFVDFKTSQVEAGSDYEQILKKYGFHSLQELILETADA